MKKRRGARPAIAVAGLLAVTASCASAPGGRENARDELKDKREKLERMREDLSADEWRSPESLAFYLDLFDMPADGARARLLESGGRKLFALNLRPAQAIGKALIVHGYMAHSGHFGATARAMLDAGYETMLVDLPGFGLSEGKPNAIDDFHDYGDAVAEAVVVLAAEEPGVPLVAVGHSTGAAALTDFAFRYPERAAAVDRFVLAAPLVRLTGWGLKLATAKVAGDRSVPFPRIPLISKGTILNPAHRRFVMDDPLYETVFDPSWVLALDRWIAFIGDGSPAPWPGRVLLLQGEIDDVVDRSFNLPILGRVFPREKIVLYPELSHCILQEEPDLLAPVLEEIAEFVQR